MQSIACELRLGRAPGTSRLDPLKQLERRPHSWSAPVVSKKKDIGPVDISDNTSTSNRQVRFDLSKNLTVHSPRRHKGIQRDELWYSPNDCRAFRRATYNQAKKVASVRQRRNDGSCDGNKESDSSQALSYVDILEITYNTCRELKTDERAAKFTKKKYQLRQILGMSTGVEDRINEDDESSCHVGMDNLILPALQEDREERRAQIVEVVSEIQSRPFRSEEEKLEKIRRRCERISRPARTFAEIMGTANVI